MSDFKRVPVLIDAATGKQIDEFGAVVRDNDFFRLLFDETVILCCQFYDVDWIDGEAQLSAHSIDSSLNLSAFASNVFDPMVSFMFLSEQTQDADNKVNIANDWFDGTTADPAIGQLSFRIDTNTTRFSEVLQNSSGTDKFYFCITGIPDGQTEKTVLAYFRFKAENRPYSSVGMPASADPEYLDSLEVQALINTKLDKDFSVFATKAAIADTDTIAGNDSENLGAAIGLTFSKIWTYISGKLFPGTMAVGNLTKYGTGGILEDTGIDPADILVDTDKGNLTEDTSSVLTITGGTGATLGSVTIQVKAAATAQNGYLSSTDWNTFNGKQDALGFTPADSAITVNGYALTGNITLDADDLADGVTNAIITLTQETNFETAYTHSQAVTGNPHSVSKSDIGLANVPNVDCSTTSNITEGTNLYYTDTRATLATWFSEWSANAFPQDINTTNWTNITAFPAANYDDYNYPVFDVDYATAEGLGLFFIEIPAGTSNLITKILAQPLVGGATGDNMHWNMDFCIYRAGSAEGTITTIDLGATAFNATGQTETAYSKALSSITDGTLTAQAGDMITIAIYPKTSGATSPKQTDWQVMKVRFEVN